RRVRRAALFLAGMLPATAGWQIWVLTHAVHTEDPAMLYYTSYMGLERAIVHLDNLPRVLWYNTEFLLRSISKLVMFDVTVWENRSFEVVISLAAISGSVRLVRRSGRMQYPTAAAGFFLLMLGYHYTADERLALPLYPLVLM